MPRTKEALPHWDLSNVYGGLEADDFQADLGKLEKQLHELEAIIEKHGVAKLDTVPQDIPAVAGTLAALIQQLNDTLKLKRTLSAYVYSFYTTDSYNKVASRRVSEMEQVGVRLKRSVVRFEAWVGSLGSVLDEICREDRCGSSRERSPASSRCRSSVTAGRRSSP
jgi:hypothetical protein